MRSITIKCLNPFLVNGFRTRSGISDSRTERPRGHRKAIHRIGNNGWD